VIKIAAVWYWFVHFFLTLEFPRGSSPFSALANINSENHTARPAHPWCQKQLLPPTNNKENIAI